MAHAGGRPVEYRPEFAQQMIEFFSKSPTKFIETITTFPDGKTKTDRKEIAGDLPSFTRFAHNIGFCRSTLLDWAKTYPEFSSAYKKCIELQEDFLMANGLKSLYAQPFSIFAMKNLHKWTDRTEVNFGGDLADVLAKARAKYVGEKEQAE